MDPDVRVPAPGWALCCVAEGDSGIGLATARPLALPPPRSDTLNPMTDENTLDALTDVESPPRSGRGRGPGVRTALVLCWSAEEPDRMGEVLIAPTELSVFGRGEAGEGRVGLVRQRPGRNEPTAALRSRKVSRQQLRLQALGAGRIQVENVGRAPLRIRGEPVPQGVVGPGDIVEVEGQLLFYCVERPAVLPALRHRVDVQPFGEPDASGIVGEGPAVWLLRDRIGFVAPRRGHVLVLGSSGTGKELVARAIHGLSERASGGLVSRNAATIPATLIDAELFGNARNYPNPGMAERRGLVGEADGATLFLDEIGELPPALQAHLLRLMDRGEYQRLGESIVRRADIRLVGATNRDPEDLKADFGARFRHVIHVPDLDARRADLPLLVRHLLRRATSDDRDLAERFLDADGAPRVSARLMRSILGHPLDLQIRELDTLLWRCLGESPGEAVDATPDLLDVKLPQSEPATDPGSLSAEEVQACLDKHGGRQSKVWRELGLQNRYVLRRLIQKYGLRTDAEDSE